MISARRLGAIVAKEIKQLARDRITFGMVVMVPLVQLLLFGYAINTDVRHIPTAVFDASQTSYSRELIATTNASQVVDFKLVVNSLAEAEAAITRGDVRAALIIPADYSRRLIAFQRATKQPQAQFPSQRSLAQWLVDGSDTVMANAIKSLRNFPVGAGQSNRQVSRFAIVFYFNPEQRTAVNTVPGLLAVILTMTMILFTSAAVVREREEGNMEFLIATPIRPFELMLGKILPYIVVGLVQTGIILGLGHLLFDVPINGGLASLLLVTLLFICASLSLGLFISTLAKTQLQAMQMTVFVLLPSILLSGFMFPYEAMPKFAQTLAEALPATHFVRTIRGVVLRAAEINDLYPDLLWLAGFAIIGLFLASRRFHKRLD